MAISKEALSRKKARTIPKKQTSIRWSGNTPPHVVHPRPMLKASSQQGLLRRVLLLLLGRAAY
jgi:hypothetical protein